MSQIHAEGDVPHGVGRKLWTFGLYLLNWFLWHRGNVSRTSRPRSPS